MTTRRGDLAFIKFFDDLPHYTYICYGVDDNDYSYYVCLEYECFMDIQEKKGLGIPYKVRTQKKHRIMTEEDFEIIDDEDMERMKELDKIMEKEEMKYTNSIQ